MELLRAKDTAVYQKRKITYPWGEVTSPYVLRRNNMDDNTKNTSADSGESPEEVLDFTEEAAKNTGEVLDFTEEAAENTGEVLDFTEEAAENTGEVLDFTEDTADGNEAAADDPKRTLQK